MSDSGGFRLGPNAFGRQSFQATETAATSASTSSNSNSNSNQNSNSNNNTPNDDDFVNSIWGQVKTDDKGSGGPNAQITPQTQNSPVQPSQEERLQKYFKDNGLEGIQFTDAEKQAFKDGSMTLADVAPRINQIIQQGHLKAVQNAKVIIDDAVSKAVNEAVTKATGTYQADNLRKELYSTHPYMEKPLYAPIAESIFKKFLEKPNATKEQAIRATDLYFKKLAEDMNGGPPNSNSQLRSQGNGKPAAGDWLDVLNAQ